MNDIAKVIEKIEPLNSDAMREAQARQNVLTKPTGSLGFLEELSIRVAGIKGEAVP
ncbi:nicotinate-nucleotide--dimethylbenzimidazole phosphoribosyltransferase, partial [Methanosarcinales archaeon]